MGVRTSQGFNFKLVANGVSLDLFQDETITISDNVTGLFDVGTLPIFRLRTHFCFLQLLKWMHILTLMVYI